MLPSFQQRRGDAATFKGITIAALAAAILASGVPTASAWIIINGNAPNGVLPNGTTPNGTVPIGRDTAGLSTSTGTALISIELPAAK